MEIKQIVLRSPCQQTKDSLLTRFKSRTHAVPIVTMIAPTRSLEQAGTLNAAHPQRVVKMLVAALLN